MGENIGFVLATMGINCAIGLADRIAQICYYCITNFTIETVRNTALTFCILPSGINLFMILIYLIFHHEEILTPLLKTKFFFMYLFSFEALFPIGVHKTFRSKYSENADNVMITMKVINALHIMFISLPQLLIVTIHSSAVGNFKGVDIASLVLSVVFIVWSIAYYFLCTAKEENYESVMNDYVNDIK